MDFNEPDQPEQFSIVIDNGSSMCRVGFAGEDAPSFEFPSCVGRHLHGKVDDCRVGDNAHNAREVMSLSYPVKRGIVTDWDDMEKIWSYAIHDKLKAPPEEFPVIASEAPLNPKANGEMMAQVLFEGFGTPAFLLAHEPHCISLSCFRSIRTIVSVGEGVTYVTCIYVQVLPGCTTTRLDFGGCDITDYLQHRLYTKGHAFTSSFELELLKELKETACFVSNKSTGNSHTNSSSSFALSDGSTWTLGIERVECPEIIFCPDGRFNQGEGLAKMVYSTIQEADISIRRDLYANILLAGGSSGFPGFQERLEHELKAMVPPKMHVRVMAAPERQYHAWIGSSILGSMSSTERVMITKQMYEEYGPQIVHCGIDGLQI